MDAPTFQRILTSFADTPADVDLSKGRLLVQIRNELFEARLFLHQGAVQVEESSSTWPAEQWLIQRIAQLPLLADRILTFLPQELTFVVPAGTLLDELEITPTEQETHTDNALATAHDFLARRPAGTASVLYLTADAGEGKTTVIYEMARRIARAYKQKQVDWLLVPISLGGRPFLRFDDVIVAALVNRLRFPFLYYESFIELVRLGALVPALDGFEEMFIESAVGDAVSALGNLMRALQSSGTVLIAARRAYFEFKRLATQARLFDTLGGSAVTFARLGLHRWDREKFLEYAEKRHVDAAEHIYTAVSERIGAEHPLLTRAVLVKRLLDVALQADSLEGLLTRLAGAPTNYFAEFARAIITREAQEKWIDKSGDPARPLLSEEEHHDLLGFVAQEMWTGGVEVVREDVLDLVAELFCDARGKAPVVRRQVVDRLKQHALIVQPEPNAKLFSFDHVEFNHFFLGYALGAVLKGGVAADVRQMLARGPLPTLAMDVATEVLKAPDADVLKVIELLNLLGRTEPAASFVRENAGGLAVRAVRVAKPKGLVALDSLTLPVDALAAGAVGGASFARCYFQPTLIPLGSVTGALFESCEFEEISLKETDALQGARFVNCSFRAVVPPGSEDAVFVPGQVLTVLTRAGADIALPEGVRPEEPVVPDDALDVTRRVLRAFMRATELNESTIRQKLGVDGNYFMDRVLPELVDLGAIQEVPYHGRGTQRRFRLNVPLRSVEECIEKSRGSFERFARVVAEAARS